MLPVVAFVDFKLDSKLIIGLLLLFSHMTGYLIFRLDVLNVDINISGYNIYRQDGSSKGGGVAIFIKEHLHCSVVCSKSVLTQFDVLVLNIKISKNALNVAGWLPSAPACTLPA